MCRNGELWLGPGRGRPTVAAMITRFQIRNGGRVILGLAALLGGAAASAPAAGVVESAITEFSADRRAVAAAYAVPWAEAALDREAALLTDWQGRVESVNYGALAPAERVDWHLLRSHLAGEQETLTLERTRLGGMEPLLAFRRPLQELLGRQELRQEIDPQSAAGVLAQALQEVKALHKRLEEGRAKDAPAEALKPGPVLASRTAGAMDQLRDAMGEWFKFYHGFQPDFSWWVRQPHEALAKGLEETAGYLRKEIAGLKGEPDDPLIGDPIGSTALAARITREMIPYSAEELLALAEREFAWCDGELQKAAAAMGCQDGKQALAKIKEGHALPGAQAASAVAATATGGCRRNDCKTCRATAGDIGEPPAATSSRCALMDGSGMFFMPLSCTS